MLFFLVEFDIRLIGGSTPHSGQVEVFLQGSWGTLCTNTWTETEADAICHHMGYAGSESNYGTVVTKPDPTMRAHNLDLNCEKGEAYHQAKCWAPAPGCRLSQPLRVTCSEHHARKYTQ